MGKNKYIINDDSYCWNHHRSLLGCFNPLNHRAKLRGSWFHNLFIVLCDNILHGSVVQWRD